MEVTVLDVTNPPTKPVLAIHAGSVRRQAKLEVNQPFVIPHPGSQTGPVEVSLFQQLASCMLPSDSAPEAFCNIPFKKDDGQSSQVKLRVRRGEAVNAGKKQKTDDDVGLTRDYLDHHQLQQRIQSLIQDVLREQPENPYKYMVEQLRKSQDGTRSKESTQSSDQATPAPAAAETAAAQPAAAPVTTQEPAPSAPAVPRPPEQPKPSSTRGRNAKLSVKGPEVAKIDDFGDDDASYVPTGEAQVAARFSVTNLLRMPLCQKAAEQSLRNSARSAAAVSMSGLVLNSVKEKIAAEVSQPPQKGHVRSLARSSLALAMEGAATLLSPEYQRAVCSWARYVAYRGAGQLLGATDQGRRCSMPTPIVFLQTEGGSWGSWLTPSASPSKS